MDDPWDTGSERVWLDRPYTGLQYTLSAHATGPVHTGSGQACSPLDIPMGYG